MSFEHRRMLTREDVRQGRAVFSNLNFGAMRQGQNLTRLHFEGIYSDFITFHGIICYLWCIERLLPLG